MRQLLGAARRLSPSVLAVASASAVVLCLLILQPGGRQFVQAVDNLSSSAAGLFGGAVCLWRCRTAGPLRRSWLALGVGLVGWGVGQAIWSWYELVAHREVPFPSMADAGFLTFPVAAAVALLLFPRGQGTTEGRVRSLLDGLIIACSLLVLSMESVLAAVIRASAETTFALVISVAYPIGDLVVASMALLALSHARRPQRARLIWIALGLGALVVADSVFAFETANGTYQTAVPSDVGWVTGFLVLGVLVTRPSRTSGAAEQSGAVAGDPLATGGPSMVQLTLPYVPFVAASGVILWQIAHDKRIGAPLALLSGLVLVLVYARQLLTLMENRRLVAAVRHQAFHDSLTGLANRALFLDRLEAALRSRGSAGAQLAVAFLDLDDFKEVNDGLGHAAGDDLLVHVAGRLRSAVRSSDLVARLGGDEFAVLLQDDPATASGFSSGSGMTRDTPAAVAERLVAIVRDPFDLAGQRISVTTSVGLAVVAPHGDESAMHILRNADLAMYAAKQSGKGRFEHFDLDMSAGLLHDLRLRQELTEALESDQFFLLYQPLYDLRTDRLCGAEALVRWAHPSGVTLAPAAFLRQAETPELMPELGRKLLERACREVREWLDQAASNAGGVEPEFFVSVNLSALQLTDRNLPGFVERTLERFRLEPRHLLLEVTESALLTDIDAAARVLSQLSALGIRIALDDFGTGYSSLAHLHQLPVHVLKTDRTFVADITDAAAPSGMVTLVAEIGSSLNLLTVAEGVETLTQLEALRRLGYDVVQGYLLGRPGALAVMSPVVTAPLAPAAR
ncbi:MAG: hypothetical protein QOC98_2062 [Frankiaceae bacterium]|nr:hypothetical protein [Frankiaceae bacterium]